jgi:LuxR family maltose regulon positive regulatory protein
VQRFLLRTSILEQLCAPLCDALLKDDAANSRAVGGGAQRAKDEDASFSLPPSSQPHSAAILESLDHANLFVTALDEQREWYRYHQLFRDLLRQRLEQTWPDLVPSLHRRASLWHEQHGSPAEAARHALAAGDVDRVAQLAERDALAMFDRGELASLAGWLNAVPPEAVYARPWLCVARAWTLAYAGPLEALDPVLEHAKRSLAGLEPDARRRVAGHLAAIGAYAGWLRGEGARSAEQATEALLSTFRILKARSLWGKTPGTQALIRWGKREAKRRTQIPLPKTGRTGIRLRQGTRALRIRILQKIHRIARPL